MKNYFSLLFFLISFYACAQNGTLENKEISDEKLIVEDLGIIARAYKNPSKESLYLKNFGLKNVEVLGYAQDFVRVRDTTGKIGYVWTYTSDIPSKILNKIENDLNKRIEEEDKNIFIHSAVITDINSAGGVNVGIEWMYRNTEKDIKYIYFTLIPYNDVGDIQQSEIGGDSQFIGQATGPIQAENEFMTMTWENAWYNHSISCVKITKVRVEYMDGSSYIYVRELPKIMDSQYQNNCK